MGFPRTPRKSGEDLREIISRLNDQFALDLPNPLLFSPSVHHDGKAPGWRIYSGIKRLYFGDSDVNLMINDFEEWVCARQVPTHAFRSFSGLSGRERLVGPGRVFVSSKEREERLRYLGKLVDDAIYLFNGGSYGSRSAQKGNAKGNGNGANESRNRSPRKRRISDDEDEEEFHTAPNSPVKPVPAAPAPVGIPHLHRATFDNADFRLDPVPSVDGMGHVAKSRKLSATKGPSFLEKLTTPDRPQYYDSGTTKQDRSRLSFSTATTSFLESRGSRVEESFSTELTEPLDDYEYEDSIAGHMLSQEARMSFNAQAAMNESREQSARFSTHRDILNELYQSGPFSVDMAFPASVPLRYRYELERIGREWDVPSDRLLVGKSISLCYQDFWKWIAGHNQRNGKPLPDKSSRSAWEAAASDFKSDKHSEVVVLTGDLDWCAESEPGILKLKLKPLRTEKSCRFYRRFGSDRFMTLSMPPTAQPPGYLRHTSHPAVLRESIAEWLTQNVHRCMGRTWRPFYVEESKVKRKSKTTGTRFRVELFAVDGIDFDHSPAPSISPSGQSSDGHTPMSLESLIDWHMPREANLSQSDCKLFQRFSLGLSKTFSTIALKPSQVLPLKDDPNRPVMNDGCALMSRSLANAICDSLGITGNTPSCFQGRIAGAKGLWMVNRHQSMISTDDDDFWIQISDSQLKIKPHPHSWTGPFDSEKLTFEVVKWSKPLHPVNLNVQLLGILQYGGDVKEYIAELTRAGIQTLYEDFAEALQSNSNVACRSLIQKILPTADDASGLMGYKVKRLEQWVMDEAECIIRLTEAGFAPQSFYPLRHRLGKCLKNMLDRYVDELHIEVPLSTYAFCIADPYGVLNEDEVHFGFSSNWRDPEGHFEDNLLDGIDVLVGRLPAHLPSDIQRRRAVWKPELRHFKDVIVFPTKGEVPLAHMLSGGDYDGDAPWICWDQNIVQKFRNSPLPTEDYSPEYFGLTKHSTPMEDIPTTDDFLQRAFTFNLTLSSLGRCTKEHERLSYDESLDSARAKELACLLSHLVDGRKGGVHLSMQAWEQYRKTISPMKRDPPAYENPERRYKRSNIIDYLKFEVATQERHAVLKKLEKNFPQTESHNSIDEDLVRPWNEACKIFKTDKPSAETLREISKTIESFYRKWVSSIATQTEYSPVAKEATEAIKTIRPPAGTHPIFITWQNSESEWQKLLASCTYKKYHRSSFTLHAFGETLCQMKASTFPSRMITHEILACYKVNKRTIQQLMAKEFAEEDMDAREEFKGEDAIEAMVYGGLVPGAYYDDDADDAMSVE